MLTNRPDGDKKQADENRRYYEEQYWKNMYGASKTIKGDAKNSIREYLTSISDTTSEYANEKNKLKSTTTEPDQQQQQLSSAIENLNDLSLQQKNILVDLHKTLSNFSTNVKNSIDESELYKSIKIKFDQDDTYRELDLKNQKKKDDENKKLSFLQKTKTYASNKISSYINRPRNLSAPGMINAVKGLVGNKTLLTAIGLGLPFLEQDGDKSLTGILTSGIKGRLFANVADRTLDPNASLISTALFGSFLGKLSGKGYVEGGKESLKYKSLFNLISGTLDPNKKGSSYAVDAGLLSYLMGSGNWKNALGTAAVAGAGKSLGNMYLNNSGNPLDTSLNYSIPERNSELFNIGNQNDMLDYENSYAQPRYQAYNPLNPTSSLQNNNDNSMPGLIEGLSFGTAMGKLAGGSLFKSAIIGSISSKLSSVISRNPKSLTPILLTGVISSIIGAKDDLKNTILKVNKMDDESTGKEKSWYSSILNFKDGGKIENEFLSKDSQSPSTGILNGAEFVEKPKNYNIETRLEQSSVSPKNLMDQANFITDTLNENEMFLNEKMFSRQTKDIVKNMKTGFSNIADVISLSEEEKTSRQLQDTFNKTQEEIRNSEKSIQNANDILSSSKSKNDKKFWLFSTGGKIDGLTKTGDKIPAMLNAGEWVLNNHQMSNLSRKFSNLMGRNFSQEDVFNLSGGDLKRTEINNKHKNENSSVIQQFEHGGKIPSNILESDKNDSFIDDTKKESILRNSDFKNMFKSRLELIKEYIWDKPINYVKKFKDDYVEEVRKEKTRNNFPSNNYDKTEKSSPIDSLSQILNKKIDDKTDEEIENLLINPSQIKKSNGLSNEDLIQKSKIESFERLKKSLSKTDISSLDDDELISLDASNSTNDYLTNAGKSKMISANSLRHKIIDGRNNKDSEQLRYALNNTREKLDDIEDSKFSQLSKIFEDSKKSLNKNSNSDKDDKNKKIVNPIITNNSSSTVNNQNIVNNGMGNNDLNNPLFKVFNNIIYGKI